MTEHKKIQYAVFYFIAYIILSTLNYSKSLNLPATVSHLISLILLISATVFMVFLVVYAARSFYKHRRFDSFMLLALGLLLAVFSVPMNLRILYLQLQHLRDHKNGTNVEEVIEEEVIQEEVAPKPEKHEGIIVLKDKDALDNLIATSNKPLAVKVFATWCPPCQQLKPIFKEVAKEHADKVAFVEIDSDQFKGIQALGVSGLPTIILYKNGKEFGRIMGGRNHEQLEREINKLL